MNERLEKIAEHMSLLGYTRKNVVDREVIMQAFKHENDHTIFFVCGATDENGPIQAQVRFLADKDISEIKDSAVNDINKKLIISSVEYENNEDGREVKIRSHYTGKYDRESFDLWLGTYQNEIQEVLNDTEFRKYF